MNHGLGSIQRQILFELAGGGNRSVHDLMRAAPGSLKGSINGACHSLWNRGFVDREFRGNVMTWYITKSGMSVIDPEDPI